jgi:hypothetical protein
LDAVQAGGQDFGLIADEGLWDSPLSREQDEATRINLLGPLATRFHGLDFP